MTTENDASRVSNKERGRPSFQTLLNARAPPRAFLFALVAEMPFVSMHANKDIYQRRWDK